MRVIFMGTPEFGVPILQSIIASKHKVIGVVCQPDRLGNRRVLTKPPVKICAELNNINALQFNKVSISGVEKLKELEPDIMVTAAFGQILSDDILHIAPYGVINVHASLLPYYRGSAPVHYAIINGEKKTGITIMQTQRELDSGDIIMQRELDIREDETTGELTKRLSNLGSEMIVKALNLIENNKATRTPQDHSIATYYPMLKKKDGRINYNVTAEQFIDFVRGMNPWPSAFTEINGIVIKVHKASKVECNNRGKVGEIIESNNKLGLIIRVKDGCVSLDEIQPEGRKKMFMKDYLLGHSIKKGLILC